MDWGEAALTFGAVLTGGVVATASNVWINRRELTRERRIEIHLEHLPHLTGTAIALARRLHAQDPNQTEVNNWTGEILGLFERLRLVAIVASASDDQRTATLADLARDLSTTASGIKDAVGGEEQLADARTLGDRLASGLEDYTAWIATKIR